MNSKYTKLGFTALVVLALTLTMTGTALANLSGTWHWMNSYSGDPNNESTTSACGVERYTIANL